MKILIVDDSRAIQTIVRRALEKEGFASAEFKLASEGSAALEIIESWVPDLMITDWHMPGMSGLELLQVIKQNQQNLKNRMLVGFVTTESVQERLQAAMSSGADFVMPKPFTDRQLGDAVRQAFSNRNAPPPVNSPEEPEISTPTFRAHSLKTIEEFFFHLLNCPVKFSEPNQLDMDSMVKPWLISFYSLGKQTEARGFCILDRSALALIGGTLLNLEAAELPVSRPLPANLIEQVSSMLRLSSEALFEAPSRQTVTLMRSQLLAQVAPRLKEILDKSAGRRIYRMQTSGFPPATMVLIAR